MGRRIGRKEEGKEKKGDLPVICIQTYPLHCPNALMLEKTIETYLVKRARAAGGLAIKWTAPGTSGVPDRIVFLPGGRIIFVELKAPGKKPTAIQLHVHRLLADLGADVRVIDSKEQVDEVFA